MREIWITLGLAANLFGAQVLAQTESDLQGSDGPVSAIHMGGGDHVVIALHGAGMDRNFFFLPAAGKWDESWQTPAFGSSP